jgi:V-type H+-transporting ATPase subunit e
MAREVSFTGLYIGSIVFAVIGVAACVGSVAYVGKHGRDQQSRNENRLLALLVSTMAVFCMWLQWICAYMHQMNPIITPEAEGGE